MAAVFVGQHVYRDARATALAKRAGVSSFLAALEAARDVAAESSVDARAFQVYVASPNKAAQMLMTDADARAVRTAVDLHGLFGLAHNPNPTVPWQADEEKAAAAAAFVQEQIAVCAAAGIHLVVHLPATRAGVALAAERAPALAPPAGSPVRVFLENEYARPTRGVMDAPEQFAGLLDRLGAAGHLGADWDFGLCVDTSHLWACAVDVGTRAGAEAWLRGLAALAPDLLRPDRRGPRLAFHLNDSEHEIGSGRDSHAPLLRGKMWGAYAGDPSASGLAAVAEFAAAHGCPLILERKPPEALPGDYMALFGLLPGVRR